MKTIISIILENFQPLVTGAFAILLCLLSGQFGYALIVGIITIVIMVALVIVCWDDYRAHEKRNNDFRKWTKGR